MCSGSLHEVADSHGTSLDLEMLARFRSFRSVNDGDNDFVARREDGINETAYRRSACDLSPEFG